MWILAAIILVAAADYAALALWIGMVNGCDPDSFSCSPFVASALGITILVLTALLVGLILFGLVRFARRSLGLRPRVARVLLGLLLALRSAPPPVLGSLGQGAVCSAT